MPREVALGWGRSLAQPRAWHILCGPNPCPQPQSRPINEVSRHHWGSVCGRCHRSVFRFPFLHPHCSASPMGHPALFPGGTMGSASGRGGDSGGHWVAGDNAGRLRLGAAITPPPRAPPLITGVGSSRSASGTPPVLSKSGPALSASQMGWGPGGLPMGRGGSPGVPPLHPPQVQAVCPHTARLPLPPAAGEEGSRALPPRPLRDPAPGLPR